jgi:hypothetical protein
MLSSFFFVHFYSVCFFIDTICSARYYNERKNNGGLHIAGGYDSAVEEGAHKTPGDGSVEFLQVHEDFETSLRDG